MVGEPATRGAHLCPRCGEALTFTRVDGTQAALAEMTELYRKAQLRIAALEKLIEALQEDENVAVLVIREKE